MSILIDDRAGSRLLIDHIKPQSLATLTRGLPTDVAFLGRDPLGNHFSVGIEHKRLPDALECIKNGRFHDVQREPLRRNFDVCLLLIETGIMRENPDNGLIEVLRGDSWKDTAECGWGQRPWEMGSLLGWLWTMQFFAGVALLPFVQTKAQSGKLITRLYHWATKGDHKSLKQMFIAGAPTRVETPMLIDAVGDVSLFRRVAAGLPHIGWEISASCERQWGSSIYGMMTAAEEDWAEIQVGGRGKQKRRLGKKYAKEIVDTIHGRPIGKPKGNVR